MSNAKLKDCSEELWKVQDEKFRSIARVIGDAILRKGIHVEIMVDTEAEVIRGWELWAQLGFYEGVSQMTHVSINTNPTENMWSRGEGLSIQYSNIAPPSRL